VVLDVDDDGAAFAVSDGLYQGVEGGFHSGSVDDAGYPCGAGAVIGMRVRVAPSQR
jgi:hypothetical protein